VRIIRRDLECLEGGWVGGVRGVRRAEGRENFAENREAGRGVLWVGGEVFWGLGGGRRRVGVDDFEVEGEE